ncbi:MAG: GHKL domain-containing protein [Lachnospiraceae bacterium]|nr:GHKL domain-containing protein [Lachnospiraceae bacterium]
MSPFWYEMIVHLCEAAVAGIFLLNLLRTKYNALLTLLLWVLIGMVIILIAPNSLIFRIIVSALTELGFVLFMYEGTWMVKVSKFLIKQGMVLLSLITSYALYTGITKKDVPVLHNCTGEDYTYCLLYLLILSISTSLVYQFVKKRRGVEIPWIVGTQLVIGVGECTAILAVAAISANVINAERSNYIIISVICMIVANVSIGLLASYLLGQLLESKDMDYGREISNMEYKYYEMSVEIEKNIRAMRHDISNQIQTVYALFKSGEIKKGMELIGSLKEGYSHIDQIVYCNNPVVNIILSNKKRDAEARGIETHIKVKDSLESIPITDYDLSTVICNLLDNAFDGCISSEQTNPRLVVEIFCKNQYLVIRVLNSCKVNMDFEDTDNIETTKTSGTNHGFGMPIITGIAKKYRGDFVVSARNGIFTATVVLSMK